MTGRKTALVRPEYPEDLRTPIEGAFCGSTRLFYSVHQARVDVVAVDEVEDGALEIAAENQPWRNRVTFKCERCAALACKVYI